MAEMKPNHRCKACGKEYFACRICDKTKAWRSVACSPECYQKYVDMVIEARTKGKEINSLPERTDMTKAEVAEMMALPEEIVLSQTKEELKDYVSEDGSLNFVEAVEQINADLNKKKKGRPRSSGRTKKSDEKKQE